MAKKKMINKCDSNREIELSTGYVVDIDTNDCEEGVSHLCNALIMELFIPNLKKLGAKKATAKLRNEVMGVCCDLDDNAKSDLLDHFLWQSVLARYGEIEKHVNK